MMEQGKLIIISAPSGSGKSTIIGRIMQDESLRLAFSVSATTRPRRGQEVHGVDYYYKTIDEFQHMIENDELVEYQEVYEGRYYGTPKSEVERITGMGKNSPGESRRARKMPIIRLSSCIPPLLKKPQNKPWAVFSLKF